MSDIQETFAEIIAEWRECLDATDPAIWNDERITGLVETEVRHQREYLSRLKAAWGRVTDNVHRAMVILAGIEMPDSYYPHGLWTALEDAYDALSDAIGTDGCTARDEKEAESIGRHLVIQPCGDSAKLREALESCLDFIMRLDRAFNPFMQNLLEDAIAKAKAALSAPARNCDKYATADEALKAQEQMFNDSNFANGECKLGCPECDNPRVGCKIAWLFAPATEKEGEQK